MAIELITNTPLNWSRQAEGPFAFTASGEIVVVTGSFTAGMYLLFAHNTVDGSSVTATVTLDTNDAILTVENTAGGEAFDFINNAGVLSLRSLIAGTQSVSITTMKVK